MKILMVSSFLPYPLYSGGYIRLYNLIKLLSKSHTITLICERRPTETDDDVKEVEKICHSVITVKRKTQWSISNIVKTGFSADPFLITGHTLPEMKQKIKEELNENHYDLIHAETFYIMQNIPKTYLPIVLAEHNIEYMVYRRYADKAPALIRPLLLADIYKLKKKEEAAWKRATALIAVSEKEESLMQHSKSFIVPNGVDTAAFKMKNLTASKDTKKKYVLFIGDFRWMQNTDAIKFILKEIWPAVQEKAKKEKIEIVLWVVGRKIPQVIRSLTADESVIFDEHVTDTAKAFRKADLLLAPIRVGGGTQYKILEAMASGTPVITTPLGKEGLRVDDKKEIIVSDDPDKLANECITLLTDTKRYTTIATHARKNIETNYSWEKITAQLECVYTKVLAEK
jgi:polysaccharide biosynthesis protein PslH